MVVATEDVLTVVVAAASTAIAVEAVVVVVEGITKEETITDTNNDLSEKQEILSCFFNYNMLTV
jgi:hypothetical protein